MDRMLRPINLDISWVRPPSLPFTDSRSLRVLVDLGSIEYSAVIQPSPESFLNLGTPAVTLAVTSTLVLPTSIKQEPSGVDIQLG
jgi:hypothetical protein